MFIFNSLAQGANHIFAFRFCGQSIETNDNMHFSPNQPPSSTCLFVKSLKCFTCFYIPKYSTFSYHVHSVRSVVTAFVDNQYVLRISNKIFGLSITIAIGMHNDVVDQNGLTNTN